MGLASVTVSPVDAGGGGDEDSVGAGYFEAVRCAVKVESGGVVEPDVHGSVRWGRRGGRAGRRRRCFRRKTMLTGEEREAFADDLFVGGVDVVLVADVDGDGHAGVGEVERSALRVAEEHPSFLQGVLAKAEIWAKRKGKLP